jgi:hypothetical protein
LSRFLPIYESLLNEQAKFQAKSLELDFNLGLGRVPSLARMKARSLGQFSKFLLLEQIRMFEEKSVSIAKQFEEGMVSLLLAIRKITIESINKEI